MLAELLDVSPTLVRSWLKRGWLVPTRVEHKLPLLDYAEVTIARQLATLHRAGIGGTRLAQKLAQIERHFPDVERPLAELSIVADGSRLLVRRGEALVDAAGQRQLDFGALEQEEEAPATISTAQTLAGRDQPPCEQLVAWAEELEEALDLDGAADMYRSAMLSGGPTPEICFALAEVLYRLRQTGAARERYAMAVELDEDFVEARCNLGCLLAEEGEHELAVAALEGALARHGEYADAHYHLARIQGELGNQDKSFVHWERFLSLAPESPWADEARHKLAERAASQVNK
jgi:tetratricopeptide (TPR) repeat protein